MKLVLAPMQGLVDDVMRDLLMCIGGFNECVSEFVRITYTVHSWQTWLKYVLEITNSNKIFAGMPCTVQFLSSDADNMAIDALEAVRFGVDKTDLNFSYPAPVVNGHKGDAILFKEPELIYRIVRTLHRRLLPHIPLTAKMCLDYEDKSFTLECAAAIAAVSTYALTVHARTRNEGYELPVHWGWIRKIRDSVGIPITANGNVFTLEDYLEIKATGGCDSIMLGCGAATRPYLTRQIKQYEDGREARGADSIKISGWINLFFDSCTMKETNGKYPVARLKQWLGMMRKEFAEAQELSDAVKAARDVGKVKRILSIFEEKMSAG